MLENFIDLISFLFKLTAKISPHIRQALRFVEAIDRATRPSSAGGKIITPEELIAAAREAGYIVSE